MNDKTKQFPEAGAVIYTTYRRTDGFEVSFTVRDTDGKAAMSRINAAIEMIKKEGGIPIPLRGQARSFAKPREYVKDRACPNCGSPLVYATTKEGKRFIKCSTQKYDFQTRTVSGCNYTDWMENKQTEY